MKAIYCRDPFGNILELMQSLKRTAGRSKVPE